MKSHEDATHLLWATKVNWWKTSDYTGSYGRRNISSDGKMLGPPFLSNNMAGHILRLYRTSKQFNSKYILLEDNFCAALWIVSHWLSNEKCVEMLLAAVRDVNLKLRYGGGKSLVDPHVLVRMNGFPAGVTKYEIYKEVLDDILNGPYGFCLDCPPNLEKDLSDFLATYRLISSDRKSYHICAAQLGISKPLRASPVPDEVELLCSSYIYAAIPSHSFSRSRAILSKNRVSEINTFYYDLFRDACRKIGQVTIEGPEEDGLVRMLVGQFARCRSPFLNVYGKLVPEITRRAISMQTVEAVIEEI